MAQIAESFRGNPDARTRKPHFLAFAVAGLMVGFLYAVHLSYCQRSTLQFLDAIFVNSDMHTSLRWAKTIREQGWLNPHPYHPWNTLLESIAPYPQWLQWWGGEQVFQQSPLYAYMLSALLGNLLFARILQAVLSIGTCLFIGLFTARMSGRTAGWIAFWLAALYAPFYAYTWPFLRDGIGWFLTAAVLWALSELTHAEWSSARARRFAWLTGVLLGLGFLGKETYLLLIPVVWLALLGFAWQRRQWGIILRVALATILSISPLLIRNYCVKAPLLSTSNRFPESFLWGNSANTKIDVSVFVPEGSRRVLYASNARTVPLIMATIASYPDGLRGFMKLQGRKLLTLFDPYEMPDNLSIYFVAGISPIVRLGLRYWMILAPALAGLVLSIWRRDQAYVWVWLLLPLCGVGAFIGLPVSRYRQSLMNFLIPCAAYFLASLWTFLLRREFLKAAYGGVALLAGWALILGPLSRQPRDQYQRPQEYLLSAEILHLQGEDRKAEAMLDLVRDKFPGYKF